MLNNNGKLLCALYQNIRLGVQSIDELMSIVKNEELRALLSKQLSNYNILSKECEMLAKAEKLEIKDNSLLDKSKLWCGIKMKTAINKTPQNIAEMLIIGSNMGIIDIIKEKADNKSASEEVLEIALRLEQMQENDIQNLKPFLEITK